MAPEALRCAVGLTRWKYWLLFLPLDAPPLGCCAWRLHLDSVARTIGALSHENPVTTAGVMDALTYLFVGDVQFTMAVGARDTQHRFVFKCRSRPRS
jgi:hypothetical protein